MKYLPLQFITIDMNIFLIIICILFAVAALDLVVGVSNDAVNFLNSAIGSKVASFRTILIIASLGILLGSVFSSGIMEVARKGIFNPELFTYDMIMYLFLGVMLTDIILLDFFNSLGLPTSTTVSLVFELLGAGCMIGLFMTVKEGQVFSEIGNYINGSNALKIISGIFLSIFIAFILGAIGQYLSRLVFSFDYEKNLNRFGALFGSVAITAISYFLIIKGLKGSPLKGTEFYIWIQENTWQVIVGLIVFWLIAIQLLMSLAKVNPLKVVVLAGTFALAMAFAGNDLVNFIGVPVAAFSAYQHAQGVNIAPENLYMDYLAGDVKVNTWLLLGAGIIMILTLWFSAKARKVTETEVNLGRQEESDERFKASTASRAIVKTALGMGKVAKVLVPNRVYDKLSARFRQDHFQKAIEVQDQPAFDLVRASVNLMMASIIIAYATSKKMPLSTTFVSFMVAMGTSLSDRAWGRESAVYRVAGVLSVIGGWLMTAIIAFSTAALFSFVIAQFKLIGIIIVVALAVYALISSQLRFNRKQEEGLALASQLPVSNNVEELLANSQKLTVNSLNGINNAYTLSLKSLPRENVEMLSLSDKQMKKLMEQSYKVRSRAIKSIKKIDSEDLRIGRLYLMASDLIQDISQSAKYLTSECLYYVKNLHQSPNEEFVSVIQNIEVKVSEFLYLISDRIELLQFDDYDFVKEQRDEIRELINEELEKQVESIQINGVSTKQAIMQTELLLQSRDILAVSLRLYKLYKKYLSNTVMEQTAIEQK